jgi:uncharacterized membrane protein YjjB (DUF3815 family)
MDMLSEKKYGKGILVAISCLGWVTNHFVGKRFPNQSDISAAVGWVPTVSSLPAPLTFKLCSAFAVGVIANIYGRFFRGNAFAVMVYPLSSIICVQTN